MKGYGTGSTPQMVVQAITGVLGGLNAGNPGQVLAGGLNPAVAQLIKQSTGDNREAKPDGSRSLGSNLPHNWGKQCGFRCCRGIQW